MADNAWKILRMLNPESGGNTEEELDTRYTYDPERRFVQGEGPPSASQEEWRHILGSVLDEIGIGAYQIAVNDKGPIEDESTFTNPMHHILGAWTSGLGLIELDPEEMRFLGETRATPVHEAFHAADSIYNGYSQPKTIFGEHTGNHHRYYPDFDRDFGEQLRGQREIEETGGTDPKLKRAFPWLNQVKPHSSNKLANPWQYYGDEPELPPTVWNLVKKAMRDAYR